MTEIEVLFDADAHPADAIQRAAYRYCDRFAMSIQRAGENFRCVLSFRDSSPDWKKVVDDFRVEVLDQVLRQRIRRDTEGVRNIILALAFSNVEIGPESLS
jgi:His-Xaa-Ser system protein HxsD